MPTLEERVAYLEGRLADNVGAVSDLRDGASEMRGLLRGLDATIDGMGASLNAKIDAGDQTGCEN